MQMENTKDILLILLSVCVILQQIINSREHKTLIKAVIAKNVTEYAQVTDKPHEKKKSEHSSLIRRNMKKHNDKIINHYQQMD